MNKKELEEKLVELGIDSNNMYPKTSFPHKGNIYIGLYKREMKDDFYFFNYFDEKIYKWEYNDREYDLDRSTDKYLIPLDECKLVWENKPYVELPDAPYNGITIRQFACIHLKVPQSGIEWLDNLIKEGNYLERERRLKL